MWRNISRRRESARDDLIAGFEKYLDYLYGFALSRLRNETAAAEDLVQETLLAALEANRGFSPDCSEKTWLTGILKHKIIDHFRKSGRQRTVDCSNAAGEDFFQAEGGWKKGCSPSVWNEDPAAVVENQEFWRRIDQGLADLPKNTAAAFVLREIEGRSTDEVCRTLQISKNNLWVMLHRARLMLRNRIEVDFFGTPGK